MSSLEAIWALEGDPGLTDDQRADAIAEVKAAEWGLVALPVTVGTITITGARVQGQAVEFTGTGGTLDWPLRLVNAPIGVLDPAGPDVDALGQAWRVDCRTILEDILGRFQ